MVLSYWVKQSMRRETCRTEVAQPILRPASSTGSPSLLQGAKADAVMGNALFHRYNSSGHNRRHSHAAQPNILAAKALSLALAAASASLHAVKASRISFDFGSSLLAASRSALAAA